MNNTLCTKIIESSAKSLSLPNQLIDELEQFTSKHYYIDSIVKFNNNVLGLGKIGDLAVYYDKNKTIIGFTRLCIQRISIRGKEVMVYSGETYHDQRIDLCFTAARFSLTKAMRHKLAHPEDELVYFANANTPSRYQFLTTLTNTIYPKEGILIPEPVLSLVEGLKKHNNWISHPAHPMLIRDQMPLLHLPDLGGQEANPLFSYYASLNPDYGAGNCLLVYLPLNLATISQGIKRVVTKSPAVSYC